MQYRRYTDVKQMWVLAFNHWQTRPIRRQIRKPWRTPCSDLLNRLDV